MYESIVSSSFFSFVNSESKVILWIDSDHYLLSIKIFKEEINKKKNQRIENSVTVALIPL